MTAFVSLANRECGQASLASAIQRDKRGSPGLSRSDDTAAGSLARALRVLVIEDHKSVRDVTARCLRLNGFEVDVAEDGEIGLTKALDESYDVVLLDWRLPRKTGAEVLRGLRLGGVRVPVVVMTAFAPDGAFEAGALGAVRYLAKPLNLDILPIEVRQAAGSDRRVHRGPLPCLFSPCPVRGPFRLLTSRQAVDALTTQHHGKDPVSSLSSLVRALSQQLTCIDLTIFEFVAEFAVNHGRKTGQ